MLCALLLDIVIIKWGMGLQEAIFANNFENFVELVKELPDDGKEIFELKSLLNDTRCLSSNLAFINSYFVILPSTITKLETRGLISKFSNRSR